MSKALVIQGVNFSTNKLTTVTLDNPVPCTGISLSQSTLSFTSLTSSTLTATLTPNNTTDTVTWTSSDTSVATVSDGVVTSVGLGSATITATCGSQSATCSVNVTVVLSDSNFANIEHKMLSGTDLTNNKDYVGSYGNYERYRIYLSNAETESRYKALTGTDESYDGKYPIMIPANTVTIEITGSSSATLSACSVTYLDSTQKPTYSISGKGSKAVTNGTSNNASNNKVEFTVPTNVTGLDSFVFHAYFSAAYTDLPEGLTITFKPAST